MSAEVPVSPEFPRELGTVALHALTSNGYTGLDELALVRASELLSLHGIGPKAIRILSEQLSKRGLSFKL